VYITTDCGFEKSLVLVIIVIIAQMLVRKNLSINKMVHAGNERQCELCMRHTKPFCLTSHQKLQSILDLILSTLLFQQFYSTVINNYSILQRY